VTPQIGFRLHLLSNVRQEIVKERRPKRRLLLRDWNRSRNTLDEPFTTTDRAIDLTMKRAW
jgi:hypothetical protein